MTEEIQMTKILIVEDNELNRDMLQRRLERKGYDVSLRGRRSARDRDGASNCSPTSS